MEIVFTVLILLTTVALSGLGFSLPSGEAAVAARADCHRRVFRVAVFLAACHVRSPTVHAAVHFAAVVRGRLRIPKRELYMQRRAIFMLALGLVFITVGLLGYFLHAMIPSMPLPVAFALAAVLSPTDAVALTGMFSLRDATVSFFIIAAGGWRLARRLVGS